MIEDLLLFSALLIRFLISEEKRMPYKSPQLLVREEMGCLALKQNSM